LLPPFHCRLQGHGDVISGIGFLPAPLDCYVTSSWDHQLRLWKRPVVQPQQAAAAAGGPDTHLLAEDSEGGDKFVSEYEKAHPLIVPNALSQVRGLKRHASWHAHAFRALAGAHASQAS
jgi:hypothetical protein